MVFFFISFVAGILTILAPCILPLLPIVIGTSDGTRRYVSARAVRVILSLTVSVVVFTLLLRASTLLIDIPQSFWAYFSGTVIILVGVMLFFPQVWSRIPLVGTVSRAGNRAVGSGYQKKSVYGDILMGAALGPVFTTCSPTYLFIIATILPATAVAGVAYLIAFALGLMLALFAIAYFGQRLVGSLVARMGTAETVKKVFGILIILVGIAIITGYDKKIEAFILDSGYGATIQIEDMFIDRFNPLHSDANVDETGAVVVPPSMARVFPSTDFTKADQNLSRALSGGPGKDGIPSIDSPRFHSIESFDRSGSIQAIVLDDGGQKKVYPYNILNWHEIVNDTVNEKPVAITFCPLCGSALVFDRHIDGTTLTFGVSGFLLESNMIMFDRETETLWQQSTGRALAGKYFGSELSLYGFQLMTIDEVRALYPNALVLSEETGHRRDYGRNPYAGYEESEGFYFPPSQADLRFPSKMIVVAFRINNIPVAVPWEQIFDGLSYTTQVEGEDVTLKRQGGILSITTASGEEIPFYFEMWFSWAVQNGEGGMVLNVETAT